MRRKGAFNFNMAVKTFLIILLIGLGLAVQPSSKDTIAGIVIIAALGVFTWLAWGN